MSQLDRLELESLSLIETQKYNSCVTFLSKSENLQCIIDSSKFEDLSEGLQQIFLEQAEN